jgi:S-adenosylmethionine:tRNA ribosyltransferase-isomerase
VRASDFDYALPPEQIAHEPLARRDEARLYILGRDGRAEARIRDLPSLLPEGALVVVNDTRVIPARLRGKKPTGGRVELLLVEPVSEASGRAVWRCLGGASKPIRPGPLVLDGERAPAAEVVATSGEYVDVAFVADEPGGFLAALARIGEVPLPPYINRGHARPGDAERYQTVYARAPGAVAAPTAGLHFTPELFGALEACGITTTAITLHVGPGTFAPLRTDEVDAHELHAERYVVPPAAARAVDEARRARRPVVAVGTTVVRTLESALDGEGRLQPGEGTTRLFIRPGYRFRAVDGMVTNFHLPRSTLLMLVCAFGDTARVLTSYTDAVARGYRFYSYGDAMLIWPQK